MPLVLFKELRHLDEVVLRLTLACVLAGWQLLAVHSGGVLHTRARGCTQGHSQRPGGDVQRRAASHAWAIPSVVPLPGKVSWV